MMITNEKHEASERLNNVKKQSSSLMYVFLLCLAAITLLSACGSVQLQAPSQLPSQKNNTIYDKPTSKLNPATRELLNDENYQNIILPDALDLKVANKEDFVVYMFAANCQYCKATTPQIMPLADEVGLNLLQFNLLEYESYFNHFNVEYTPTILAFKNGVEVERLVGGISEEVSSHGVSLEQFREFFEKYKK